MSLPVKEVSHRFWSTQPVPQEVAMGNEGPIDRIKTPDEISDKPLRLPTGFSWVDIDLFNEKDAKDVYTLLLENYVEDDDAQFRFAYSIDVLKWALTPPGYIKEYHIGVRGTNNGHLYGFITATPQTVCIRGQSVHMVDVNFLCVHKKIRSKRLAPVLIREVTRRVNRHDGWQAIYTAGIKIPTPITEATYFHRALNIKKLIDIGFAAPPRRITLASYIKYLKVPTAFTVPGIRPLTAADIPAVVKLLSSYLEQFAVHQEFSEAEAAHFFLPRENVVGSYVRVDEASGEVTDFFSFFHIQSSVMGNRKYDAFTATYCYYYANTSMSMQELMQNMIIAAQKEGGDVFNALEVMRNGEVFENLKFARGDGTLHYYFYNWKLNAIKPAELAVVLPWNVCWRSVCVLMRGRVNRCVIMWSIGAEFV